MNVRSDILAPRARQKGLVVRDLDEEIVVFDLERSEARLLNGTAALVWRHCDGETTISDLVEILRAELGRAADEQTVWHALLQLGKDQLLEQQVSRPAGAQMSRRQMMQRVGVAMAAATVTSIAVGGVAHAASCNPACKTNQVCTACTPSGSACCNNGQFCCSGSGSAVCCTTACCNGICCPQNKTCVSGTCQ